MAILVYRSDHHQGGVVILEILKYKEITKFLACWHWKTIFQYGNTTRINFNLNELQSKAECFIISKENTYSSISELQPVIQADIENFIKVAREGKVTEKILLREAERELEEVTKECKELIIKYDHQIKTFSNFDTARELEKRGLI